MIFNKIIDRSRQFEYFLRIHVLVKQIVIFFSIFQLYRIAFFIINYSYFAPIQNKYIIFSLFYGILYDLSAIVKVNSLYILLFLIPSKSIITNLKYKWLLNILFITMNCLVFILIITDIEYFKFVNKRITYEFVYYLKTMNAELFKFLPAYIFQYWYLFMGYLITVYFIIQLRLKQTASNNLIQISLIQKIGSILFVLIILGTLARGVGKLPIKSTDITKTLPIEYEALATNTPFMVIEALTKNKKVNHQLFLNTKGTINTEKQYAKKEPFTKLNVMIIILEGFSKEYIGSLNNNKGYTPFLDSLIKESFVCRNAFANGRTTLQALPAILCSLPSLNEEPLVLAINKNKNLNSIAEILNSEGYSSAFFYGAKNGNLGINNFAHRAGFKRFFGKNEFGKENSDSPWGIFDDEFLQFTKNQMDSLKEPFISCLLTLSSHTPFIIPGKFQQTFKNLPTSQLKTISYTDFCLKQFFKEAQKSNWFNNTLFVLVADHTSNSTLLKYNTKAGKFSIPIIYYHPNDSKLLGSTDCITQQCDIKPTILDYLHYPKEFISFGSSIFMEPNEHYAVMTYLDQYQYINNKHLINLTINNDLMSAYRYKEDELLLNNLTLSDNYKFDDELNRLKVIINESFE